jgi:23S rRNA pseudouridine1911/1915/1917 synthase
VKTKPPQPAQQLEHYLLKNRKQNKSYVNKTSAKEVKKAVLDYKTVGASDNYHLLKVRLLTGRPHQIRCQLAHIGCPVKGDLKYGFPRSNPDGGISLHAGDLEITHKEEKVFGFIDRYRQNNFMIKINFIRLEIISTPCT